MATTGFVVVMNENCTKLPIKHDLDLYSKRFRMKKANTHVFIFYNPRSGNRQGERMQNYAPQFTRLKENINVQVQMYNLLDQQETHSGIGYIGTLLKEDVKLLICSAGGDGSFVSILEAMSRRGISVVHDNIYFSVFGFGTGNDLSQSMNWGRYIPKRDNCFL